MTTRKIVNVPVAANDDLSVVDHLLAAYRLTSEPFGKHLIELALIHEGQKIAQDNPDQDSSPHSLREGSARSL